MGSQNAQVRVRATHGPHYTHARGSHTCARADRLYAAAKRCVKEIRYALSAQAAADVGVEALKGAAFHPITVHDKATRLAWEPPQEVEFIGSIASGTAVSSGEVLDGTYTNTRGQVQNVDIALQMPRSCFLAKDHLNHKYSDKRALYLAVVLRVLRGTQRFAHAKVGYLLPGDTSKPIITVGPHTTRLQSAGDDDEGRESGLPFQLRIIPHPGPDGLAGIRKLLPSRNCNRGRRQPGGRDQAKSTQPPTPTYNNRLLEDLHLTTLSAEICTCIERNPNLGQAMTIAKVWLLQRRLHIAIGGVRPYQMCLLMCFLAGSSNGQGGTNPVIQHPREHCMLTKVPVLGFSYGRCHSKRADVTMADDTCDDALPCAEE
eukprot:COSAG05_NODE_2316_length_3241_cov_1.737110_2_plen_373_part_00